MDRIADQSTTAAMLAPVSAGQRSIRPEILEVFRKGGLRHEGERKRQNYQDVFDRLIGLFGQSPEMAVVTWCIASNLAQLMGDSNPIGWRWGGVTYNDPSLEKAAREYEAFERHFLSLARKFLPVATKMRDCQPFYDAGLDDSVKALQPFAHPQARAADHRSEWHSTAQLFAERIETHFRSANLKPPTRNSARGPLVLAVQSLLEMVGQRVETETIRKALWQPRSSPRTAQLCRNQEFCTPKSLLIANGFSGAELWCKKQPHSHGHSGCEESPAAGELLNGDRSGRRVRSIRAVS